jgi:hypothetical protein
MKNYLYCKYEEKEKIKELGAHWDPKMKKWYKEGELNDELKDYEEIKIDVPYELKDDYKEKYSIRWSADVKSWITNRKIANIIENEV